MKKILVLWDGKEREVLLQKIKGQLWFHFDGVTRCYTPAINKATGAAGVSKDPTKMVAPMPGKIMKVLKKVGDVVKAGETVIVMEAMKMEYNLKAEEDLKIKSINTEEEKSVSLGALLVELEKQK